MSRRARESSDGLAKPPRCRVRDVVYAARGGASRSASAAPQSDIADPCPMPVHLPGTTECASIPEAAPGRRWPAWPPRPPRRIPACRPVSRSVGAPADHAAQGGSKVAPPYHAAPRRHHRRMFSIPHRRRAPAPFSARSLPTSPPRPSSSGETLRLRATERAGSDSAEAASDPAAAEHDHAEQNGLVVFRQHEIGLVTARGAQHVAAVLDPVLPYQQQPCSRPSARPGRPRHAPAKFTQISQHVR